MLGLIAIALGIVAVAGLLVWLLGYMGVVVTAVSGYYIAGLGVLSALIVYLTDTYSQWLTMLEIGMDALLTGSNWYYATFFVGFVMLAAVIIGNLAITLTDGKKGFKVIR